MQEEPQIPEPEVSITTQTQKTNMKDLLIPISIVIAGLLVGIGLYFSGSAPAQPVAEGQAEAPAEPADNTSKVNPVTDEDHILGDINAPIKIVEYSDFDCPFCSRYHDVMLDIVDKYPGEVAWVFRQFPLESLHPQAPAVSMASECVAELGGNTAFWSFTDGYFEARGAGSKVPHAELIPTLVIAAGINQGTFTDCFESGRHAQSVQDDVDNAVETGGRGTPWSILIGPTGKTYPINGALPISAVEQLIKVDKQEA